MLLVRSVCPADSYHHHIRNTKHSWRSAVIAAGRFVLRLHHFWLLVCFAHASVRCGCSVLVITRCFLPLRPLLRLHSSVPDAAPCCAGPATGSLICPSLTLLRAFCCALQCGARGGLRTRAAQGVRPDGGGPPALLLAKLPQEPLNSPSSSIEPLRVWRLARRVCRLARTVGCTARLLCLSRCLVCFDCSLVSTVALHCPRASFRVSRCASVRYRSLLFSLVSITSSGLSPCHPTFGSSSQRRKIVPNVRLECFCGVSVVLAALARTVCCP